MAQTNSENHCLAQLHSATRELIETYHELNASVLDELSEEPSALEFMQYVARNRPFVVRKAAEDWAAVQKWDSHYLLNIVGDSDVSVAITPKGNADSVTQEEDGSLSYVKPLERSEPFDKVIRYIAEQETNDSVEPTPIKYAQTQNDNLRNEYSSLFRDVPHDIHFARIALNKHPDAINFWLGNSLSTTSLHKDNYENIYITVRGQKHFVLLPPIAAAAVNERYVPGATYVSTRRDEEDLGIQDLVAELDKPRLEVPVPVWDPEDPEVRTTQFSGLVKPLRVTLGEGDMLYLPAMWYHKVGQSCGDEGYCCAVNYWYDMEFAGSFWAANSFVRDAARVVNAVQT